MQQNSSISITSKHFIDRLENDIVQLAKALSVEYSLDIESAKLVARQTMQRRLNQLLTKDEQEGIKKLAIEVNEIIKANPTALQANFRIHAKKVYELLKTMELL